MEYIYIYHNILNYRHRQQLIQQMQMIGGGAIGPQAANAIRHVAAQNGVWSLGNFGGVPPRTAGQDESQNGLSQQPPPPQQQQQQQPMQGAGGDAMNGTTQVAAQDQQGNSSLFLKNIDDHDYRHIFNSCTIPMVSRKPKLSLA